MPCRSDYLMPNEREIAMSKVACLLDEIDGKPINYSHWNGGHPKVYGNLLDQEAADAMTAKLCSALQNLDVTKYSLEMQMWWRDHQKADEKRLIEEIASKKQKEERDAIISRLSPHERKILGIKD